MTRTEPIYKIDLPSSSLIKEPAGVLSERPCWVFLTEDGYMYTHAYLLGLAWLLLTQWGEDEHLVG
jgi:hypothetical protein